MPKAERRPTSTLRSRADPSLDPGPGTLRDLDLQPTSGTWPDHISGEVFISASAAKTAGRHAFFGDGWMTRLSL